MGAFFAFEGPGQKAILSLICAGDATRTLGETPTMPKKYRKSEAKEWTRQNWHGLCNVIIPSYSSDLKRLNETGIRHDVRRNIELGFWGALLVSEAATTDDEYIEFMEIAVDEAKGKHNFLFHGCFDTVEDIVRLANAADAIGVDGVLLGHPPSFYPQSEAELYDFTEFVCNRTDLGVVGFAQPHWNFNRLHPSGYPPGVMLSAARLENLVACKFEVGGMAGHYDFWLKLKGLNVLYSDPMEANFPMSVELFGQQWSGTSGYEIFGGTSPRDLQAIARRQARRSDGPLLEGRSRAAVAHPAFRLHVRVAFHQSIAVEILGLAERLQRRADAPAC